LLVVSQLLENDPRATLINGARVINAHV